MAKKERQKRSARKARQKERAEREELQAAQAAKESPAGSKGSKLAASSKAQAPKKADKGKSNKKPGPFARIKNYFRAVRTELHRVVWPGKQELRDYSVAVIAMLIIFGVVVWLVDTGVLALLAGYTGLRG